MSSITSCHCINPSASVKKSRLAADEDVSFSLLASDSFQGPNEFAICYMHADAK